MNKEVSYVIKLENKVIKSINQGVIGFCKVNESYGILGNMASNGLNKLSINVNNGTLIDVVCSETLFVCMKFIDSDIQEGLRKLHGMSAKMSSKRYKNVIRPDFDDIRLDIMRWVLRVKLFYNQNTFGKLLKDSGDNEIVEVSSYLYERKNNNGKLWGVCKYEGGGDEMKGYNWLGKLLVELREEYKSNNWKCDYVKGFDGLFCGYQISDLKR